MTNLELMKIAKYGIEKKIEYECALIANSCVNSKKVAELKQLLEQYDEIMQTYEAARKLDEEGGV